MKRLSPLISNFTIKNKKESKTLKITNAQLLTAFTLTLLSLSLC